MYRNIHLYIYIYIFTLFFIYIYNVAFELSDTVSVYILSDIDGQEQELFTKMLDCDVIPLFRLMQDSERILCLKAGIREDQINLHGVLTLDGAIHQIKGIFKHRKKI